MPYEYTRPRGPIAAQYSSPGPCYALPSLIGAPTKDGSQPNAPAYHFGLKHKEFTTDTSPGPIYSLPHLKISHKNTLPVWTLASRKFPPSEAKLNVPGPGAYDLRKAGKALSESAPAYTFGTRPKGRKTDMAPAPNNYSLPPIVGKKHVTKSSAPQFTMVARSKVGGFDEDLKKTPGPCAYNLSELTDKFKNRAPAYSITSRTYMPEDATIKPGPGAHQVDPQVIAKKPPAYSFGLRHSQYAAPIADIDEE